MHCSLSAFLVGFHVHEKALLVPAVVSALLAFRSAAAATAYLRLSFLAAFATFPLLPGAELRVLKVRRWRDCFFRDRVFLHCWDWEDTGTRYGIGDIVGIGDSAGACSVF